MKSRFQQADVAGILFNDALFLRFHVTSVLGGLKKNSYSIKYQKNTNPSNAYIKMQLF